MRIRIAGKVAAFAAIMGLASPLAAKKVEIGGWLVDDEPNCVAVAAADEGISLGILYDTGSNRLILQVRDNGLAGVVNDETYRVQLTFKHGDVYDKGWKVISVTGLWDQDSGKGFEAQLNADAALDDLRKSDAIIFSQPDDDSAVLVSFGLANMVPVVDALRRCGQQKMAPHRTTAPPRRAPARRR